MPEQTVRRAIDQRKRHLRATAILDGLIVGSAAAALIWATTGSTVIAALGGAAAGAIVVGLAWRRWTDARVALAIEASDSRLQNLVVTAQEALGGRAIHPVVSRELFAQAADRLSVVGSAVHGRTSLSHAAVAIGTVAAAALLIAQGGEPPSLGGLRPDAPAPSRQEDAATLVLRVTVVPPAYTRRDSITLDNPAQLQALEGSTIRLHAPGVAEPLEIVEPGGARLTVTSAADGSAIEFVATASRVFLVRRRERAEAGRLLQLHVARDERPVVTIEQPGRDLLFGTPSGNVPIRVLARDDLNVAELTLRYTHIAGSGETFTFQEGDLPLQVSPAGMATSRAATGTLVLDQLKLEDGDALVYRALARDDKPGADPVASESFLIEIGKRGEASSTGFSLPEDRERQGLSQQMLIMKTERLQANRAALTADAALEQSRLLAVEQRMVRAEFVFMTGGEVVDEVEEAEHSHELAAGRLENAGQVELLNAIREMSRAEARLNAGDTTQALVFERAALAALERAFDRRRYFLRTLPERTRIDPSRRLAGDVSTARPAAPGRRDPASDHVAQDLRDTIAALGAAVQRRSGLDASLAAQVVALDPQSPALQQLAIQLASSPSIDERVKVAMQAQAYVAAMLRERLAPAAGGIR